MSIGPRNYANLVPRGICEPRPRAFARLIKVSRLLRESEVAASFIYRLRSPSIRALNVPLNATYPSPEADFARFSESKRDAVVTSDSGPRATPPGRGSLVHRVLEVRRILPRTPCCYIVSYRSVLAGELRRVFPIDSSKLRAK